MPVKRCKTKSGKSGYKYGSRGKCYKSKSKASRQGRAIRASGYKKK